MSTSSAHSTNAARADTGREIVPLAKIATIVSGFGFPKELQGKTIGDFPFFKVGDISAAWNSGRQMLTTAQHYLSEAEAKSIKARAFPKGTIVFAKIGEAIKLNRRAILGQPALVDNNVMGLIPDYDLVDHRYLFYWTLTQKLGDISQATTVPSVRKSDVEELEFPLVHLDQQKRIVAEIEKQFSRLDEAVANLKRVKANLKRYKAAVLKAAVEGRLVETEAELARREGRSYETGAQLLQRILETRRSQWKGKGKYKEPAAPDTADLPELPEGWVWAALDQLSWDSSYGTSAKCAYENKGPPVLRIPNVDKAAIDLADVKYAPSDLKVSKEESLSPGDMLVIRTNGSKSLIGRAAVVTTQFQKPTTYASYLIRFRLLGDAAISAWVLSYWQSHSSRLWIESKAATSAGQHNISMSVLATAPMPLPPSTEQDRIVAEVNRRLAFVLEVDTQVNVNIKRSECLRSVILGYAFNGSMSMCGW